MLSLTVSFSAFAGLVYEQEIETSKLKLVRVDPEKAKGNKEDIEVEKAEEKQLYSQRILLKGELMKIRSEGGITIIYDRSKGEVTRIWPRVSGACQRADACAVSEEPLRDDGEGSEEEEGERGISSRRPQEHDQEYR
ncbi:MAG: hypothetical protein U5N86_14100 [Planctomycetota bacterium]|nr:hypothetical protein [Planctomycetota bacterium]